MPKALTCDRVAWERLRVGPAGCSTTNGRLPLEAAVENARSRAVAERLGMTLEGVAREAARLPGGSTDIAHYGLLDREWQAARER